MMEREAVDLDQARGFTVEELSIAVKVLENLDPKKEHVQTTTTTMEKDERKKLLIDLKEHKTLRKALLPFVEMLTGRLYRGKDPEEYKREGHAKKAKHDRNQRLRALDKEIQEKTSMRQERIKRLEKLQEEHPESVKGLLPLVPDGIANVNTNDERETQPILHNPTACYVCKKRYTEVHHFYATLCPECADENWFRRKHSVDMRGRIAIVTGARVKIGFRIAIKLLKAGCTVYATTRFPEDARERFLKES